MAFILRIVGDGAPTSRKKKTALPPFQIEPQSLFFVVFYNLFPLYIMLYNYALYTTFPPTTVYSTLKSPSKTVKSALLPASIVPLSPNTPIFFAGL